MTADHLSPADELAELRAEIARLQRREAALQAMLEGLPQGPPPRQGWPILRNPQPARA